MAVRGSSHRTLLNQRLQKQDISIYSLPTPPYILHQYLSVDLLSLDMAAAPAGPAPISTIDEINFLYDQHGILPPPDRDNAPKAGEKIDMWLKPLLQRIREIHTEQDQQNSSTEQEMKELNEELEEEEADLADNPASPRFCAYIDSADQEVNLSVESVLRFVGTNDCNEELIDFMTSRAGLALRPKQEDGSCRRVLTVAQGRGLFGSSTTVAIRNHVAAEVELATLDYALVPFLKPYKEIYQAKSARTLYYHAYFVVLCGMSGNVGKRVVWADSMWAKTTPADEEGEPDVRLNEVRTTQIRHDKHHLGIPAIREKFVQLMQRLSPDEWPTTIRNNDVPCRFLRTTTYENHGCAIALIRGAMAFMRQPALCMEHVKDGRDGEKLGSTPLVARSVWAKVWRGVPVDAEEGNDEHEGFTDVANATLILVRKLCLAAEAAADGEPPRPIQDHEIPQTFRGFGLPRDVPEDDINFYFYPRILQVAWKIWLFVQSNELDSRILYYAVYREEYNDPSNDHGHHISIRDARRAGRT
ncbi:hypothetical protein QFC24_006445 [Naganishia onofrii]|uniref:Uncharacterized protein n=1 Tax=Naganishia onofrii TaxID=1851511 RepID=A0ACC2X125_9TREE|nr:hypothetical protein QFC24_006445 [Naganishia onofrii]